ncbi:MAG: alkaline phosphatase [Armatimonadetes bacterium]|jgi:alkaline phosphatase|nr:alkaline phosphatase [Armatimonadota bacterium]
MLRSTSLRRIALIALTLALLATASFAAPKNVILLIGDGMGVGPVAAGRIGSVGPNGRLTVDTMPFTGFALTHSANRLVTDSAAAGTALATGVKTNNGTISMDPDGKRLKTILELARDLGKSTGLISTSYITDATPAVFASHVSSRGKTEDIAAQMLASRVDVILGGGKRFFTPKSKGGVREDERNLMDEATKRGYSAFDSADALTNCKSDKFIGLFADHVMTSDRPEPTIAEMTDKTVSTLSKNAKGFFIMSEGGKIDHLAHGNNKDGVIKEMTMFDDAVKVALDFAKKDGQTLVVVTADHDTGGMAMHEPSDESPKFTAGWTTKSHTGNMVPVYAYGPGAELFTGTLDNTDIPNNIAKLWGRKLN